MGTEAGRLKIVEWISLNSDCCVIIVTRRALGCRTSRPGAY